MSAFRSQRRRSRERTRELPRHGALHKCQLRPLSRRRDISGWSFAHVSSEEMRASRHEIQLFHVVEQGSTSCPLVLIFSLCLPSPPFLYRLTNPISRRCFEEAGCLLAVLGALNCWCPGQRDIMYHESCYQVGPWGGRPAWQSRGGVFNQQGRGHSPPRS